MKGKIKDKILIIFIIVTWVFSILTIGNHLMLKNNEKEMVNMLREVEALVNEGIMDIDTKEEEYLEIVKRDNLSNFEKGKYSSALVQIYSLRADYKNMLHYGNLAIQEYEKIRNGELLVIQETKYLAIAMIKIGRYSEAVILVDNLLKYVNSEKAKNISDEDIQSIQLLTNCIYLEIYSQFEITDKAKIYYEKLSDVEMSAEFEFFNKNRLLISKIKYARSIKDYNLMKEYSEELYRFQKNIDEVNGTDFSDLTLMYLGYSNIKTNNLEEGYNQLKKAEMLYTKIRDCYGLLTIKMGYSEYYEKIGEIDTAFNELLQVLEALKHTDDVIQQKNILSLIIEFIKRNNIDNNLEEYYNLYYSLEEATSRDQTLIQLLSNSLSLNQEINTTRLELSETEDRMNSKRHIYFILVWFILICYTIKMTSLYKEKRDKEQKLLELVNKDYLTGATSRGCGYKILEDLIKENHKFSIALLDIDNFKRINDTYGHTTGDEVLKYICNSFKEKLSSEDIIIRTGGEEFILIFSNKDINYSFNQLDRIREEIHSESKGNNVEISFSAGITERSEETLELLIDKIDKLLYKAKNQGKNIIIK